jgi:hypothetical protein
MTGTAALVKRIALGSAIAALTCGAPGSFAADVKAADAKTKPGYQIQCFEDPATQEQFCFAPAKLTANGRVRASPLYAGKGPDITLTAFTAVADCRKSTVALRYAQSTAAKDAPKIDARVAQALARDMCAATKPAVDKNLKL